MADSVDLVVEGMLIATAQAIACNSVWIDVNYISLQRKAEVGGTYAEIARFPFNINYDFEDTDELEEGTTYYYRAVRYNNSIAIGTSNEVHLLFYRPSTLGASANMVAPAKFGSTNKIDIERKSEYVDDEYESIGTRQWGEAHWSDPGPFEDGVIYFYRAYRDFEGAVSDYFPERSITYHAPFGQTIELQDAMLSVVSGETCLAGQTKDVLLTTCLSASAMAPSTTQIGTSNTQVEGPMSTSQVNFGFYYAWGTGPTFTDQALVLEATAAMNAPTVIIPKSISTTVSMQVTASASGALHKHDTKASPLMSARANGRLSGPGDEEHNIDGFIVTVHKTASADPYTMGTTPTEEYVHYVTPEKRTFTIYGVPADSRYHIGVQAYRMVDDDIDEDGVIKSPIGQYPASNAAPIVAADVNFTGNVNDVPASDIAAGAAAGTSAKSVTDTAFNEGLLVASWKPGSATAVPYSFSGLFANNQYMGFVTRGADPASPEWKTFLDNTGNFYLGGTEGGLVWTAATNTLGINFSAANPGGLTMSANGFVQGGKDSYASTTSGFYLGYSTDAYKLNVGDANAYMKWTGTDLQIKGEITVTNPDSFAPVGATQNFNTQPTPPYNVGDTWLDTSGTTPKAWKCTAAKAAGAEFAASDWTISSVRIFPTSQPVPPYAVGDVWAAGGTVYYCTTARATGSFVLEDWSLSADKTNTVLQAGTTITGGGIILSSGGAIYSAGKTSYNSATAGFFLGYSGSAYTFGIGSSTNYLQWNGTSLAIKGDITGSTGTFDGTLTASNLTAGTISLGSGVTLSASGLVGPGFNLGAAGLSLTSGSISLGNNVSLTSNGLVGPNFTLNSSGLTLGSGTQLTSPVITGSGSASFASGYVTINNTGMTIKNVKGGDSYMWFRDNVNNLIGFLSANDSGALEVQSTYADLSLVAYHDIYMMTVTTGCVQIGESVGDMPIRFGGVGGPLIYSGAGSPSGGTTGSLWLSTGGSLWFKQAAGWRRIDNWAS